MADNTLYKLIMDVDAKVFKTLTVFPKGGARWTIMDNGQAYTVVRGKDTAARLLLGYSNITLDGECDEKGNLISQSKTKETVEEPQPEQEPTVTEEDKDTAEQEAPKKTYTRKKVSKQSDTKTDNKTEDDGKE